MYGKLAKAVLITTGAFWMFPLALETGKFAVVIAVAAALLVWFLWAVWRVIVLCRARAFRTDAEPWQRVIGELRDALSRHRVCPLVVQFLPHTITIATETKAVMPHRGSAGHPRCWDAMPTREHPSHELASWRVSRKISDARVLVSAHRHFAVQRPIRDHVSTLGNDVARAKRFTKQFHFIT